LAGKVTSAATGGRTLTLKGAARGVVSGVIENGSSTMSVSKADAGTWTLSASNTYTGTTTVSGGTLLVKGVINSAAALLVNSNATLGGNGRVLSPVSIAAGGTLAPGVESIGRMTISNTLSLASNSLCVLNLSKAAFTNDAITGVTDLNYGGVLRVTNLTGTLTLGDGFKLFGASNYSGAFTSLQLPPLGEGLTWSNRLALDGTLAVTLAMPPMLSWQSTSSNALAFSWPDYYAGFRLQMQTNSASLGLGTNWVNIPGATNGAAVVPMTNSVGTTFFPSGSLIQGRADFACGSTEGGGLKPQCGPAIHCASL
jgi:autotransporter-associated beta strand protein